MRAATMSPSNDRRDAAKEAKAMRELAGECEPETRAPLAGLTPSRDFKETGYKPIPGAGRPALSRCAKCGLPEKAHVHHLPDYESLYGGRSHAFVAPPVAGTEPEEREYRLPSDEPCPRCGRYFGHTESCPAARPQPEQPADTFGYSGPDQDAMRAALAEDADKLEGLMSAVPTSGPELYERIRAAVWDWWRSDNEADGPDELAERIAQLVGAAR